MREAAALGVGLPVQKVQLQPWAVGSCRALGLAWQLLKEENRSLLS